MVTKTQPLGTPSFTISQYFTPQLIYIYMHNIDIREAGVPICVDTRLLILLNRKEITA